MSGKKKIVVSAGVLVVLAGIILVMNADAQKKDKTVVKFKARFISGDTIIPGMLNKIVNDDPAAYYENLGNNTISIGEGWTMKIQTDRLSSRYVNLYFDDVVSGPGQNLPSGCAKPHFIYPVIIAPITTTKFYMKGGGEFEMIPDPDDPDEIPTLSPKDPGTLDFTKMTEGQEVYTYATWFYFNVQDLMSTKGTDESRVLYAFADCLWVKVTALDWDGAKVNRWVFKPVIEAFKHVAFDGSGTWCYHPEGAIPYMLFSNSSLSCDHGTYRMPWELEIIRQQ